MKAEAALKGWGGSKTAEQYYYEGIEASFEQYGIQGAAAYKERDGIKWGTSSIGDRHFTGIVTSGIPADPFAKIVVQRWIAMFNQGLDAWCLERRTRAITWPPHLNPHETSITWSYPPERMVYSTNERTLNEAAYKEAAARLDGGDDLYTPLKMNKPVDPIIDWEAFPAKFNNDFGKHWYGNSIDDLVANGIEYTILNK
jgi:hypothetical protein